MNSDRKKYLLDRVIEETLCQEKEFCKGCQEGLPSQKDHSCLGCYDNWRNPIWSYHEVFEQVAKDEELTEAEYDELYQQHYGTKNVRSQE